MTVNRDRKLALLSLVAIVAVVLVQFLFWRGIWFGRPLDDQELTQFLEDENPRKIQHALEQIVGRVERGDPDVEQWYSTVSQLASNPHGEVRTAAAWMMGHVPQSSLFHETLMDLLDDSERNVRRNAALALVRFADSSGILEVRAMLQPHGVKSPIEGEITYRISSGQEVEVGTPLALIKNDTAAELAISEVSGRAHGMLADGSSVEAGEILLLIRPGTSQVWESLRALYFIGEEADLDFVEKILHDSDSTEEIRRQAAATYQAIRKRAVSGSSRVSK